MYRWKKQHHDERRPLESDSDESLYDKYGNRIVYSTRHHGRLRSPDRGDSRSPKVTDLPHSSLLWFDVILCRCSVLDFLVGRGRIERLHAGVIV